VRRRAAEGVVHLRWHDEEWRAAPGPFAVCAVAALAEHPRGIERADARLFRWSKSGTLYVLVKRAFFDAGLDDGGQPGLTDTGAWKDAKSARRYTLTIVSESACKAELLPIRGGKPVENKL
jgi:hypothetical protein